MKRPILYCAISFTAGISLSGIFHAPTAYLITASLILIITAAALFRKNILSHVFLYIAIIFFGAAYYQNYNILPKNHIVNFVSGDGDTVIVRGVVADDPVRKKTFYGKERTSFTLKSEGLSEKDKTFKVTGLVKASLYTDEEGEKIRFGDEIEMPGKLSFPQGLKNPGLFDYPDHLKIKGIYVLMSANGGSSVRVIKGGRMNIIASWAYSLRKSINAAITHYVDRRYSGFLSAILTGERSGLDTSVMDDFIKTGTVHVIAISGLNIVLIAGIFMFIFKMAGIKRKYSLLLASFFLVFYCFLAGAAAPVVRATIMFVIASLGYVINRESDILNSLAIAAFLILLNNPNELFDPGFQLSFASIFGIVLFSPRIESLFGSGKNYFTKGMAVSIAAIIAVSPIVARYFNVISPISIIANLVIVPALFVITVVSFLFIFLSLPGAGFILSPIAYAMSLLSQATFYINHLFAQVPFAYFRVPAPSIPFLLLYYTFVMCFFFLKQKKILFVLLLIFFNFAVWSDIFASQNRELKITFLDVGKGDAILIEFPDRRTMLIDAGSGGMEGFFDTGRSIVAPYLWNKGITRLDAVLVTHFHSDHMGGMIYVLKNFGIGCVMDGGMAAGSSGLLYDSYRKIILKRNLRRLKVTAGDEIAGFNDTRLFIINPREGPEGLDANNSSVVLKLQYRDFSVLFCGDIADKAMEAMLGYGGSLKSDVIKVPHHGGSTGKEGTSRLFFQEVAPKVLIISSGAKTNKKHLYGDSIPPGPVTYNTKENGAIELTSDGSRFKVKEYFPVII
ncbi:MAG: DNA internalization-related competence protein ComEC/Rec2 [Candidatus Omnitrophota bacterium]|jgi:competence protein ComEC